MSVRNFRDLDVWNKAMKLTNDVYDITLAFPSDEKFGLVSQLRRAVVSVPSNIAEGSARGSSKEFIYFLNIAKGSLAEVITQLILSNQRKYIKQDQIDILEKLCDDIDRMIFGLIRSLKNK